MEKENLIAATEFCHYHNIDVSFVYALHEYGLLDAQLEQESLFISANQLTELERMIRLHYELHINLEGIDAIRHLLEQLETVQCEMQTLKNKLHLYEENEQY